MSYWMSLIEKRTKETLLEDFQEHCCQFCSFCDDCNFEKRIKCRTYKDYIEMTSRVIESMRGETE